MVSAAYICFSRRERQSHSPCLDVKGVGALPGGPPCPAGPGRARSLGGARVCRFRGLLRAQLSRWEQRDGVYVESVWDRAGIPRRRGHRWLCNVCIRGAPGGRRLACARIQRASGLLGPRVRSCADGQGLIAREVLRQGLAGANQGARAAFPEARPRDLKCGRARSPIAIDIPSVCPDERDA